MADTAPAFEDTTEPQGIAGNPVQQPAQSKIKPVEQVSQQAPAPSPAQDTSGAPVPEDTGAPVPEDAGAPVPEDNGTSQLESSPSQMAGFDKAKGAPLTTFKNQPINDWIDKNLELYHGDKESVQEAKDITNPEASFLDQLKSAVKLYWKNSDLGIASNGLPPPIPPNPTKLARIAGVISESIGDLPSYIIGGGIGAATSAPIEAIPGVGQLAGAAYISGTANAFHAGVRKALIDQYEKGDITTASDFMDRLLGTAWEQTKGFVTGAAGGAAGKLAAPGIQAVSSELLTMATVGSALEGRLPDKDDIINGIISTVGIGAAHRVYGKVANTFVNTGQMPAELFQNIARDPQKIQQYLDGDPNVPPEAAPTKWDPDSKQPIPMENVPLPDSAAMGSGKEPGVTGKALEPSEENKIITHVDEVPEKYGPDSQDMSDSQKKMLSYIGANTEPKIEKSLGQQLREEYGKGVARDDIIRAGLEKVGLHPNAEDSAALTQQMSAVGSTVDGFVKEGTRDFNTGELNGEAFQKIKDDYREEFPNDPYMLRWKAFGVASRVIEKTAQGYNLKVNGETMSLEEANKAVKSDPDMQDYMNRFVAWKQRGLQYMHDSGYWTPEQFSSIVDMNQSHMSFSRVQDFDELTQSKGGKARTVKALEGEGGLLGDPIAAGIMDMDMMVRRAEENRVKNAFVDDMIRSGFPKQLIRKADKASGSPGNGQFNMWTAGKPYTIETSPLIAETLNTMSGNRQAMSLWTKALIPFRDVLTKLIVSNPAFALSHIVKNERSAQVFSQTGLTSFYDVLREVPGMLGGVPEMKGAIDEALQEPTTLGKIKAIPDIVKATLEPTDAWKQAKSDRAFASGIGTEVPDYIASALYDITPKEAFGRDAWNTVKKGTGALFGATHAAIVSADNAVRFTEYQRVIEGGGSRIAAAYAARNVVPDYQRAALLKTAMTSTISFFRAHLASEAQMIDAFKIDPAGVVAKSLLAYTVPSLLIYAISQNDDRVSDEKHVFQNGYMNVPIDNWRKADPKLAQAISYYDPGLARQMSDGSTQINDGPVFKLQRSFTLDQAFGAGVTAFLDAVKQKNPQIIKEWAKSVGESMIPNLIPTGFSPVVDWLTNHNRYLGGPLVSPLQEKMLPEFQSAPWTTETARQLAHVINQVPGLKDLGTGSSVLGNPQVIDTFRRAYSGPVGDYATMVVDRALRASGISSTQIKPMTKLTEYPFIKQFFLQVPSASIQPVQDFYDNYHKVEQTLHTEGFFQKQIEMAKTPEQKQTAQDQLQRVRANYGDYEHNMTGYYKTMGNLNAQIQGVLQNPKLSDSDKSQLTEPLLFWMMGTAKHANQELKMFQNNRHAVQ